MYSCPGEQGGFEMARQSAKPRNDDRDKYENTLFGKARQHRRTSSKRRDNFADAEKETKVRL